ncbi:hypothetical protein ACFL35_16030, partial [Candidatus Riflebacteria bacterium]
PVVPAKPEIARDVQQVQPAVSPVDKKVEPQPEVDEGHDEAAQPQAVLPDSEVMPVTDTEVPATKAGEIQASQPPAQAEPQAPPDIIQEKVEEPEKIEETPPLQPNMIADEIQKKIELAKDAEESEEAIKILKEILDTRSPAAEVILCRYLDKCLDGIQISFLTKYLGLQYKSERCFKSIAPFLNYTGFNFERIISNTIEGLAGFPEAIPKIASLLNHPEARVKNEAAIAISRYDAKKSHEVFLQMASSDEEADKLALCYAAKTLELKEFIPVLTGFLSEPALFPQALSTLEKLVPKEELPEMLNKVKIEDEASQKELGIFLKKITGEASTDNIVSKAAKVTALKMELTEKIDNRKKEFMAIGDEILLRDKDSPHKSPFKDLLFTIMDNREKLERLKKTVPSESSAKQLFSSLLGKVGLKSDTPSTQIQVENTEKRLNDALIKIATTIQNEYKNGGKGFGEKIRKSLIALDTLKEEIAETKKQLYSFGIMEKDLPS